MLFSENSLKANPKSALPASMHAMPSQAHLTARQRDVLRLLATGATRQGVARTLIVSDGTVNEHISRILQRLNAQNITHAVYLATCQKLI